VFDVLRIVNYPHPVLRYVSRPVTEIDDGLKEIVRSMFELLYAAKGVGLAANQVALPFRFFVLNLTADPAQPEKEQVFINPVITKRHLSVEDEEGCLSLPNIHVDVRRAKKIRFQAYDLTGNLVDYEADELFSRAVQHETDHLDGKLIIDYFEPLVLRENQAKLRELELQHQKAQAGGELPSDQKIVEQLAAMQRPIVADAMSGRASA
jgi:peptide deformylase